MSRGDAPIAGVVQGAAVATYRAGVVLGSNLVLHVAISIAAWALRTPLS